MSHPASVFTPEGRARRRFNCQHQSKWNERAEVAVALWNARTDAWTTRVAAPLSVADFGAGNERLRLLLAETLAIPHAYHPYDLHPQLATTIKMDISSELPDDEFDLGFCLGIFEYITELPHLLTRLSACCRFVVASYVTADTPNALSPLKRRRSGWRSHLSGSELETEFSTARFAPVATNTAEQGTTTLWLLVREEAGAARLY